MLSAFQSILALRARGRVTVTHVVQVDLWQVGRLRQPLEAAGDRVGMRRLAVLLAEQEAVIKAAPAGSGQGQFHPEGTQLGHGAIFLGFHRPARGHRVYAALRASLRDGFASLDPAPTRKDSAPMRKMGRTRTWGAGGHVKHRGGQIPRLNEQRTAGG